MKNFLRTSVATIGLVIAMALPASAQAVDPTGGEFGNGINTVKSFITDTAAGPLFVLAATVLAIVIGLKWLKKAKTAAS